MFTPALDSLKLPTKFQLAFKLPERMGWMLSSRTHARGPRLNPQHPSPTSQSKPFDCVTTVPIYLCLSCHLILPCVGLTSPRADDFIALVHSVSTGAVPAHHGHNHDDPRVQDVPPRPQGLPGVSDHRACSPEATCLLLLGCK